MSSVLDLDRLCHHLRQVEENKAEFDVVVNPYLLHTVFPALCRDPVITLGEIDFDRFEMDDAPALLRYFQWKDRREWQLHQINRALCTMSPVSSNTRTFI